MNDEQNKTGNASEADQDVGKVSMGDGTLQTQDEFETDKGRSAEDYYSVDDPKKDISTNIGDGEMRNEGLVGEGNLPEAGLFSEGSTDEQDDAELHDSQG